MALVGASLTVSESFLCAALLACAGVALWVLQVLWTLPLWRRRRGAWDPLQDCRRGEGKSSKHANVRSIIVLGSGGHTSEMLRLSSALDPKVYTSITYVAADTDHTSVHRIPPEQLNSKSGPCRARLVSIPRSREVGQSWLSTVGSTLKALVKSFTLVARFRPDVILVNGPGTCVPICMWALLLRSLPLVRRWRGVVIVFCESFCRVDSLSLTGRLLYPFVDRFVVHWPELLHKYPRAEYVGPLL